VKHRRSRPETLERIANYGKRRLASKPFDAEAKLLLDLVRAAVKPMAYLQAVAIYPYLRGASELFQWADERGYDLSLSKNLLA
jgi:hypothetical protein